MDDYDDYDVDWVWANAGAFVSSRVFSITTDTGSALVEDSSATVLTPEISGVNPQLWAKHKDDNCQYTWTRLPQGFRDSPAVFSSVVHDTLKDVKLPPDTCLLQYADDILVTGASEDMCAAASKIVCNILAEAGFKASKEKLQWVQRKVTYLGHELSQGKVRLSADRIKAIATFKHPSTRKQMQSFLGLVNYCRLWVPNCSKYDKILREATLGDMEDITWTKKPTHPFVPGQSVLVKCLKPTKLGEANYLGPATVIAVTRTGVLTDLQPQWIHASRVKAAPSPGSV
ncbi:interleukin-1 receptor accessory protein-like 1-A [Pimephales promelas]|nr:interleukin-1 receptor accessory protein-like 1-A [Pimephales promelas]